MSRQVRRHVRVLPAEPEAAPHHGRATRKAARGREDGQRADAHPVRRRAAGRGDVPAPGGLRRGLQLCSALIAPHALLLNGQGPMMRHYKCIWPL